MAIIPVVWRLYGSASEDSPVEEARDNPVRSCSRRRGPVCARLGWRPTGIGLRCRSSRGVGVSVGRGRTLARAPKEGLGIGSLDDLASSSGVARRSGTEQAQEPDAQERVVP